MPDQRNLILAAVLSLLVLILFQWFYEEPRLREAQERQRVEEEQRAAQAQQQGLQPGAAGQTPAAGGGDLGPAIGTGGTAAGGTGTGSAAALSCDDISRAGLLDQSPRIEIDAPSLRGSLPLIGGRFDDLIIKDYYTSLAAKEAEDASEEVVLFSPRSACPTETQPYFAEFGWIGVDASPALPDRSTEWQAATGALDGSASISMTWENGAGLAFTREIAVDENYLFTVTQRVTNGGPDAISLRPVSKIVRDGRPPLINLFLLHEGPIGVFDGVLNEYTYDDIEEAEAGRAEFQTTGGWAGITDKYWLAALIPGAETPVTASYRFGRRGDREVYQVDLLGEPIEIAPGESREVTTRLFAGAKEISLIDAYRSRYEITHFDLAVDFGWFYFITKPFLYALIYLNDFTGNFGIAIILFTVFLRGLMFPLANKSYREMSRMKLIQPQMMELRDKYADDKERMQTELMELYKREKVNPLAGCFPVLLQIPIFFALYKVLFVSIEMRQSPFYGWIDDLSAPDPTTVFNLFGLLPFMPPDFLMIGAWPLLMGLSMFVQMRLNPAPQEPIQQQMMMFMPVMITFMLASFPAGLVIYWTMSNVLSIAQQWIIMRQTPAPAPKPA